MKGFDVKGECEGNQDETEEEEEEKKENVED